MRARLPEPEQGEPFLPGPTFDAPFHLRGDPAGTQFVGSSPPDQVSEGFIRLSAGCEDAADLLEDVERALEAA